MATSNAADTDAQHPPHQGRSRLSDDAKPPGPATRRHWLQRGKWLLAVLWVILVVVLAPFAGQLASQTDNRLSAFLPDDSESTQVIELQKRFGEAAGQPVVVVMQRDDGLTDADLERARAARQEIRELDLGEAPVSPLQVSPDRSGVVFAQVLPDSRSPEQLTHAVEAVTDVIGSDSHGLHVGVTGDAALSVASNDAFTGIHTALLLASAGVVMLLLLLTYRSPVLWALPLFAVGIGLVAAQAAVYLAAKNGLVVNSLSQGILTVIVFGAGTDYALLLVARYREELRTTVDKHRAMGRAVRRTMPAVVASGGTVIAAMLCLLTASLSSTRGLGPVVAIGVACAVAVMLGLLPVLLLLGGRWIFWPRIPHEGSAADPEAGGWGRLASRVERRPRRIWITVSAVLLACTAGLTATQFQLNPLNAFRNNPPAVAAQHLISKSFDAAVGSPALVVAEKDDAQATRRVVADSTGVTSVSRPENLGPDKVLFKAVLDSDPYGQRALEIVKDLRSALGEHVSGTVEVGGATAVELDKQQAAARDDVVIIPLVLAVILLILIGLLRALVAPLLIIATVILSVAASFGISVVAFRYALDLPGIDPTIPLFVFIFLVALGVDYNIFLMDRVREEVSHWGTARGMRRGLAVTGVVITSAGAVLAGTFGTLGILPLVQLVEVGVAVAIGVLIDTFIVRSVLLPALIFDAGDRSWWPGKRGAVR